MSTIKVDNIRIASESVSRPVTGVAAVWCNFNGTAVTAASDMTGVRGSLNVSGVVDSGVGVYDLSFSNSFTDTGYAATSSCQGPTGLVYGNNTYQAASIRILISNTAGTAQDSNIVATSIHGDLA